MIGGLMPQLDKTFPTNDCAMCLIAPKEEDTERLSAGRGGRGRHAMSKSCLNVGVQFIRR